MQIVGFGNGMPLGMGASTLNRGIKGIKKSKGPFKQNYTYLEHDVQPLQTSITIDVHHRKIFI